MSQQYDNTDRGVLFKNDRKESERHPDYKGSVNVGGREFWLSAWIKEGQKGKYMSLSVQPKESAGRGDRGPTPGQGYQDGTAGPARNQGGGAPMDDEIPF